MPNQSLASLSKLEFILGIPRVKLRKIAKTSGKYYEPYDLHKKNTPKWRHIDNPGWDLKIIQKKILKKILNKSVDILSTGMMGGISGRSIVENAKMHIGKECIGIIDIKECFPNTKHLRIYKVWKDFFGCGKKTLWIITQLTTFQDRLPQGAPTSPLLCNFALLPVYKEMEIYTNENNLTLSIFVDDITISGKNIDVKNAIRPIINILIKKGYAVRNRKVKIISSGYRQKITGIIVNRKSSIGRKKIQEIRNLILETARLKDYISSNELDIINGKINSTKQVSKTQGLKLEKFAEELLIKPIQQTEKGNKDTIRSCSKYNRNHNFILRG